MVQHKEEKETCSLRLKQQQNANRRDSANWYAHVSRTSGSLSTKQIGENEFFHTFQTERFLERFLIFCLRHGSISSCGGR